ncbi:hypothetical protein C8Q76DRAFT_815460 [Earliella scabrosa]|nr:hypothetical protein C8Q76DRAFT_815460 [Earliella scabrosa]
MSPPSSMRLNPPQRMSAFLQDTVVQGLEKGICSSPGVTQLRSGMSHAPALEPIPTASGREGDARQKLGFFGNLGSVEVASESDRTSSCPAFPVGTVPVTRVRRTDASTTKWTNPHIGLGHGSAVVEGLLYGRPDERGIGRGGFYDADKIAGLPVGVQRAGRRAQVGGGKGGRDDEDPRSALRDMSRAGMHPE